MVRIEAIETFAKNSMFFKSRSNITIDYFTPDGEVVSAVVLTAVYDPITEDYVLGVMHKDRSVFNTSRILWNSNPELLTFLDLWFKSNPQGQEPT